MNDVNTPLVSVLIPIRNEERNIAETMDRLFSQDYENIEIIVIDGDSDDRTLEILENYRNRDFPITILQNPRKIAASGLNLGLEYAKGDIIIRVDGHTNIPGDFVSTSVRYLNKYPEADCVGGYGYHIGAGFTGRAIAAAMTSVFGVGNSYFRVSKKERFVDTLAFGAYRKEVFDRIGGFDERLIRNQDDEFNARLRKAGGKILLSPDISYQYLPRTKLNRLFSQYYQYGVWKSRVASQQFKGYILPRHIIPSLFFLYILLLPVLAIGCNLLDWYWWLATIPAVFYIFLAFIFSLIADWKTAPMVFVAFFILHISYGLGVITGIIGLPFWKARKAPVNEVRRIQEVYRRRYKEGKVHKPIETWLLYIIQDRVQRWAKVFRKKWGGIPEDVLLLDVGCGDGSDLFLLAHLGVEPQNIFGVDLNELAVPKAAKRGFNACHGDGAHLPFPDNHFDIVTSNLVMTNIWDFEVLCRFADECVRVAKPDGIILIYELNVQPPYNKDVRIIPRRKLRKIFRGQTIKFTRLTLNPLVARVTVPISTTLSKIIENMPFMKTHYLAVIDNPGGKD